MAINHRHDFVLLFDVKDGNPNGDPDAGNMPRLDAETGHGLVTDVSLKRKVRNYVAMAHDYKSPLNIYVRERSILGQAHFDAFTALGYKLGSESRIKVDEEIAESLRELGTPDWMTIDESDDSPEIVLAADIDKAEAKLWIKDSAVNAKIKKVLTDALKQGKGRRPTAEESDGGKAWMCKNYFDIRTFGAVMSLKSAPNCGQVRGPVQLTFGRSIEPVVASEHTITRMAVATKAEAEKQGGDNRTMGRKHTVPYGLYRSHGFVSAFLSKQTGFSEGDLELFFKALEDMFEHDRSAARGQMSTRGLYVFKHDSELGNAHAHALFDRLVVARSTGHNDASTPARDFAAYSVAFDGQTLAMGQSIQAAPGVTLTRRC